MSRASGSDPAHTPRQDLADFSSLRKGGFGSALMRLFKSEPVPTTDTSAARLALNLNEPLKVLVFGLNPTDCTNTLRILSLIMAARRRTLVVAADMKANRGSLVSFFPQMKAHSLNVAHLADGIRNSLDGPINRALSLSELSSYGTVLPNLLLLAGIESDDFGVALSPQQIDDIMMNSGLIADHIIGDGGSIVDSTFFQLTQRFDHLVLATDLSAPSGNATIDTFKRLHDGLNNRLYGPQASTVTREDAAKIEHTKRLIQEARLVTYFKNSDTAHRPDDVTKLLATTWAKAFGVSGTEVYGVNDDKHLADIPLDLSKAPGAMNVFQGLAADLVYSAFLEQNNGLSPFTEAVPTLSEQPHFSQVRSLRAYTVQPDAPEVHEPLEPRRYNGNRITVVRRAVTATIAVTATGLSIGLPATNAYADGNSSSTPSVSEGSDGNDSAGMVSVPPSEAPQAKQAKAHVPSNDAGSPSLSASDQSGTDSSQGSVQLPAGDAPGAAPATPAEATRHIESKVNTLPPQDSKPAADVPKVEVPASLPQDVTPSQAQAVEPPAVAAAPVPQAESHAPRAYVQTVQPPASVDRHANMVREVETQASPRAAAQAPQQVTNAAKPAVMPAAPHVSTTSVPSTSTSHSASVATTPSVSAAPDLSVNGPIVGTVFVTTGDSLWLIATKALRTHLGREPLNGEIAEYWRMIYAVVANHKVIGSDPDLIRPGQELVLPQFGR